MKINCHVDPVVPPRQLALVFKKIYYLMIERACKLTIHSESWANFFYFRVKMKLDFAFQKGHNLLCKSWVRDWIFNYVTLLDYTHLTSLKIILKYIIFHNFFYWFWTFLDSNTESIPLKKMQKSFVVYFLWPSNLFLLLYSRFTSRVVELGLL